VHFVFCLIFDICQATTKKRSKTARKLAALQTPKQGYLFASGKEVWSSSAKELAIK
jgi:hypothetical protein